jgi:hypothetical protein
MRFGHFVQFSTIFFFTNIHENETETHVSVNSCEFVRFFFTNIHENEAETIRFDHFVRFLMKIHENEAETMRFSHFVRFCTIFHEFYKNHEFHEKDDVSASSQDFFIYFFFL